MRHECLSLPNLKSSSVPRLKQAATIRPVKLSGKRCGLLEEHDQNRAARLGEFNQELGRRLGSLDSGRHVNPAEAHDRLKRKSEQRRKSKA